MDSFQLRWRRSAAKELRQLPPEDVARILASVETLLKNPYPDGCVKLSGSQRSFRIQVGPYRILYDIYEQIMIIEVVKVGHRKDIYRNW